MSNVKNIYRWHRMLRVRIGVAGGRRNVRFLLVFIIVLYWYAAVDAVLVSVQEPTVTRTQLFRESRCICYRLTSVCCSADDRLLCAGFEESHVMMWSLTPQPLPWRRDADDADDARCTSAGSNDDSDETGPRFILSLPFLLCGPGTDSCYLGNTKNPDDGDDANNFIICQFICRFLTLAQIF